MHDLTSLMQLPQDLLELDGVRENTVFSNGAAKSIDTFVTKLRSVGPRYEFSTDTAHLEVLTKCWLQYLRYLLCYCRVPKLHLHDIDQGIRYFTKKKQVAKIVEDSEQADLIALLALTRVQYASIGCKHPRNLHIGKLLEQWSGHPIASAAINSMEEMVNLLYGVGTWFLYHDDVKKEEELPKYLWYQSIPLKIGQDTPQPTLATNLPFDIS